MKQTQWHSSKGNSSISCRQNTQNKNICWKYFTLYTLQRKRHAFRARRNGSFWGQIFCLEYPSTRSEKGNVHFANYRFSFRKLQIPISQTTDSHFANYRLPFRKLQISISQTTDFHFANYRFPFRKLQIPISQTTDSHFANYRLPFRKLQISILQTTDFHFANYRFPFRKLQISISQTTDFHFHFVSSHFVSQTTVSREFSV